MEYCDVIFRKILLNRHAVMNDVILTSINSGWKGEGRREGCRGRRGELGDEMGMGKRVGFWGMF